MVIFIKKYSNISLKWFVYTPRIEEGVQVTTRGGGGGRGTPTEDYEGVPQILFF